MRCICGNRSGFSIIEIMLTVAIVGISAGLAIPGYVTAKNSTIQNKCLANCKQLQSALEIAQALELDIDTADLDQAGIEAIVMPDHIKSMPSCEKGTYYTDADGYVHCSSHGP